MKRKSQEYEQLKTAWKSVSNDEQVNDTNNNCYSIDKTRTIVFFIFKMKEELSFVTSMVKKDVLRTDRQHYFYAGKDDNQNIVSLFNILTT